MPKHRIGWLRSLYYYLDWEYESKNDVPDEKSVKLKQVLMRQVSLSKLKLKHINVTERIPPDLQKIKCKKIDCSDETIYIPPNVSPISNTELSQKQRQARYGYRQL
jgi:hypothetical protein